MNKGKLCSSVPGSLAVAGLVAVLAGPALADTQGDSGRVIGLSLNESSSDLSATQRGKIVVDSAGIVSEYRWDGTLCAGRVLTEAEEAVLAGLVGNKKLLITPYWKSGQGGVRCLVSFTIGDKKSLPDIPQL